MKKNITLKKLEEAIAANINRRNYLQVIKLVDIQNEISLLERDYIDLYLKKLTMASEANLTEKKEGEV